MQVNDRLDRWRSAGIIDDATAARITAFEAADPGVGSRPTRITATEVVAYLGSVVLLVGVGFLYGSQRNTRCWAQPAA